MIIYIKFLAGGYVKEFTTALDAKEYLNECGEGEEKFYILFSAEPVEDKEFKGYPFLKFEKDQIEEAREKIDYVIANPDSIKASAKIGDEEEKNTGSGQKEEGEESEPGNDENEEEDDKEDSEK